MQQIPRFVSLAAAVAACLCLAMPSRAVVGGVEPSCADRRFDAVGLLLAALDNTQPCSQNISGSAVLISRDTVLIARHSVLAGANDPLPAPGSHRFKVRFRRAANGDAINYYSYPWNQPCHGVYTQVWIHEFVRPGNTSVDMLVGKLETPIDYIDPIPVETSALGLPTSGSRALVAGWGYQGPCFRQGNSSTLMVKAGPLPAQVPGLCCITINPCTSPSGVGVCYSCPAAPAGESWILPNYLDSGSPVLVETSCTDPVSGVHQLKVVGIVSTTSSAWTTVSWNLYTPNYPLPSAPACTACPADFNHNGRVELGDLFGFIDAWFSNACLGDVDLLNGVGPDDLFEFLDTFFYGFQHGCP